MPILQSMSRLAEKNKNKDTRVSITLRNQSLPTNLRQTLQLCLVRFHQRLRRFLHRILETFHAVGDHRGTCLAQRGSGRVAGRARQIGLELGEHALQQLQQIAEGQTALVRSIPSLEDLKGNNI